MHSKTKQIWQRSPFKNKLEEGTMKEAKKQESKGN